MFTVELKGDQELSLRLARLPKNIREALVSKITRLAVELQGYVVGSKLQGQVLHHRSGKLSASIKYNVTDDEKTVTGIVFADKGSTAYAYAGVHEFGGTLSVREHIQQRTMVFGRQLSSPIAVTIRQHDVTYPERSFLRSSLADKRDHIINSIKEAVSQETNKVAKE